MPKGHCSNGKDCPGTKDGNIRTSKVNQQGQALGTAVKTRRGAPTSYLRPLGLRLALLAHVHTGKAAGAGSGPWLEPDPNPADGRSLIDRL